MKKSFLTVCIQTALFGSVLANAEPLAEPVDLVKQPAAASGAVASAESELTTEVPMSNDEIIGSLIDHDERLIVLSEGMLDEVEKMKTSLEVTKKEHAGLQTSITRAKWMLSLLSGLFLLIGLGLFYMAYRQLKRLKTLKADIESKLFKLESEVEQDASFQGGSGKLAWEKQFSEFKQQVEQSLEHLRVEKNIGQGAAFVTELNNEDDSLVDNTVNQFEAEQHLHYEEQEDQEGLGDPEQAEVLLSPEDEDRDQEAELSSDSNAQATKEDDTSLALADEAKEDDTSLALADEASLTDAHDLNTNRSASEFLNRQQESNNPDEELELVKCEHFDAKADEAEKNAEDIDWRFAKSSPEKPEADLQISEDDDLSDLELETKSESERIALTGNTQTLTLLDSSSTEYEDYVDENDLDDVFDGAPEQDADDALTEELNVVDISQQEDALDYSPLEASEPSAVVKSNEQQPANEQIEEVHADEDQTDEDWASEAQEQKEQSFAMQPAEEADDKLLSITHPHAAQASNIDAELGLSEDFAQVEPETAVFSTVASVQPSNIATSATQSNVVEQDSELSVLEQVKSTYQQACEALQASQPEQALALFDDLIEQYHDERDTEIDQYVARSISKKAGIQLEQGNTKQALRDYDALINKFYDDEEPSVARMVSDTLLNSAMLELMSTNSISASKIARGTAYYGQQPKRRLLIEMFEILRLAQRRDVASEVDVLRMTYKHAPEAIDWRGLQGWAQSLSGSAGERVVGLIQEFKNWP